MEDQKLEKLVFDVLEQISKEKLTQEQKARVITLLSLNLNLCVENDGTEEEQLVIYTGMRLNEEREVTPL